MHVCVTEMLIITAEKYGTCTTNHSALSTAHDYFDSALRLRRQHDLYGALLSFDIYPTTSRVYQLANISAALVSYTGLVPLLNCTMGKDGRTILREILFCITPTVMGLQYSNCTQSVYDWNANSCRQQQNDTVWFLPIHSELSFADDPLFWSTFIVTVLSVFFCLLSLLCLCVLIRVTREKKLGATKFGSMVGREPLVPH